MRKGLISICAGVLLVGMLVTAAFAAAGTVIFYDDFSGDLSKWFLDTATDGKPENFSVEDGAMVFAPVWFGNAFAGDEGLTDYTVEAEYTVQEYGAYGNTRFFVRMNKLWEGYAVSILEGLVLLQRFDGNWDQNVVLAETKDAGVAAGSKHTVKLSVTGNKLMFYLDGKLVLEATDPDNKYPAGRFGLRADHNSIKVHDFKATAN